MIESKNTAASLAIPASIAWAVFVRKVLIIKKQRKN